MSLINNSNLDMKANQSHQMAGRDVSVSKNTYSTKCEDRC